MAYALDFDSGASSRQQYGLDPNFPSGDFWLECDVYVPQMANDDAVCLIRTGSNSTLARIRGWGAIEFVTGGTVRASCGGFRAGAWITIRFERVGTDFTISHKPVYATAWTNSVTTSGVTQVLTGAYWGGSVYQHRARFYLAAVRKSTGLIFDADDQYIYTGTILRTSTGDVALDASFPTDGSQWHEYFDWLNERIDDDLRDYGLTTDGVGTYVTIPQIDVDYATSGKITLELKFDELNNEQILGKSTFGHELWYSSGALQIRNPADNAALTLDTAFSVGTWYKIELDYSAGSMTATVNGVVKNTVSLSGVAQWTYIASRYDTQYRFKGQIKYISFNVSGDNRYYDFNQAANITTVPEVINGQDGALVNFPTASGYTKDIKGEITGYKFNGVDTYARTTGTLTRAANHQYKVDFTYFEQGGALTYFWAVSASRGMYLDRANDRLGVYFSSTSLSTFSLPSPFAEGSRYVFTVTITQQGDLTYDINAKVSVNGGSEFDLGTVNKPDVGTDDDVVFAARDNFLTHSEILLHNAQYLEGSTVLHNWDFTVGDADQIIDAAGGLHADINNEPTSGYLPVIPKMTFTIPNDYTLTTSNVNTMISAADTADATLDILVTENNALVGWVGLYEATHPATLRGIQPFTGDFSDTVNNTVIDDTAAAGRAFLIYGGIWHFKNFMLDGGTERIAVNGVTVEHKEAHVNSVGFNDLQTIFKGTTNSIRNSTLKGSCDTGAKVDESERAALNIYNSTMLDRSVVRAYTTLNVYNSISSGTQFALESYTGAQVNVSNSLITDAAPDANTTDLYGNTWGVDFTGAFGNVATEDYRIKQSWIDTNYPTTNAADWAYYDDSGGAVTTNLTATLTAPQPVFSASATHTAPTDSYSVTVSASAPQPVFSATMTQSAADTFSMQVALSAPQPVFAATMTQSDPESYSVNVSINAPQPVFSASVSQDPPPSTSATVAVNAPQPVFSASIIVTGADDAVMTVAADAPQPVFSASATHTAPTDSYSTTVAADAPQPVFSAGMTMTPPGSVNITADIVAPQPVFSATMTQDPAPEYNVNVATTGITPIFSARIISGNIIITQSSGTNILVGLESRNINIPNLSREITL